MHQKYFEKGKQTMKKIVSLVLALVLCCCMMTVAFAAEPAEKVLVIDDKTYTADSWVYNEPAKDAAAASKMDMLIYDKNYTGEIVCNDYGAAIVLDKDGKLIKIYDAANLGFWTEAGKSTDPLTFGQKGYAPIAFSELAAGETLIIFPHSGGDPNPRTFALSLRGVNGAKAYCGLTATLTGFTFGAQDVPEHGDNTAIFAMMAMMAVSAAAILVLNKKRAF